MIAMICVDDNGGVLFNKRRVSKDRVLREEMLLRVAGGRLLVTPYTARQFDAAAAEKLTVCEDVLAQVQPGDFCFLEDSDLNGALDKASQLILYKWTREYPSDVRLTLPPAGWKLTESRDFAGSSHEKITEEIYIK